MSRKEGIQRHRFIIHQLNKKPSTFKEILNFLKLQEEISEGKLTCSLRTFQREVKEISSLYSIAIRNRFEVNFSYRKFDGGTVTQRTVSPIAIKEARNRWYLLAKDPASGVVKNFGLDRITRLEIGSKKFREIKDFDPAEEFKYTFGIINGTGEKPEKIVLSFTPTEGRYVKSLPLHHSQKEILKNKTERRFEYELVPTYDFKMEILSYGDTVKVLEPESLRKDIVAQLKKALAGYK